MKTKKLHFILAAVLMGLLAYNGGAFAAPRLCDDGTRPPCNSGGGEGGGNEPPDYGDLIMLYRDANGIPYLSADDCWQPLPAADCPLACQLVPGVPADVDVIPVDPATCAVALECATCTQEVEFGRINVARAPDDVFANQLEDVIVNLATADCISLDPAGRLVASRVVDGEVLTGAIDSPLQNLAIYRQLMLSGYLGAEHSPLVLPGDMLDTAARALGAAADKTGQVNVDMVVYLNQIMGLSDPATPTVLPKLCINMKEEVMGEVQLVEKCFLEYAGYGYGREANFMALPAPAYIPAAGPIEGWFEHLAVLDEALPSFYIIQGPIQESVFGADQGNMDGNVGGFAQAADDARAVINFMHNWPVPTDYETAVTCLATGDIAYDVSISDISGLQVPVRMVAGTEGREFTLTVNNESASPDAATGSVILNALDANGNAIASFPRVYPFSELLPGTSLSWTEGFSVAYKTTVTWTATAIAEFDVNPGNNSVIEITTVTGGGGGGRR
jgi:hypothetical protein